MTNWQHRLKIKHLLTENEDYTSVQSSMSEIAKVVRQSLFMDRFSLNRFDAIPKGDDTISSADYANKLLERLYDFADAHQIWIE
jgi:hypothetical protein